MLDPLNNPSRDYFGQSHFSDTNARNADVASQFVGDVIQNRAYVSAAERAARYRAQSAQGSQPSIGGQIGSAVAGAATGAAVTGIIGLI